MSEENENKSVSEVTDVTETTEIVENTNVPETEEMPVKEVAEATPVEETSEEVAKEEEVHEAADVQGEVPTETSDMQGNVAVDAVKKTVTDAAKKLMGNKKLLMIATAAIVLLLIIANAAKIGNAAVKLFTSPAGYFRHVEGKVVKEVAKETATTYDIAISQFLSVRDAGSEGRIGVELGKEILDFLEDETEMDFEWLKEFSVGFGMDSSKKGTKAEFDFSLDGKKLISLLAILNLEDGKGFLQIPELNESYLGMDIEELFALSDVDMDLDDIDEMYEMYEKIYDALPNKSKIEKVMERYGSLLLSSVDDVEQSKEEVSVGEYSKKLTVLEASIDEKTLQDALEAAVKELKKDKDVKKIIFDVAELQDEMDADEIYDTFIEALEDLEDEIDDLDEEEFELVWKTYVDSKGNIQGRSFEIEDADVEVTSLMVRKGRKFTYEFSVDVGMVNVALTGSGKARGMTVSGDFVLDVMGLDILEATLDDMKLADWYKGDVSGTVSVKLARNIAKIVDAAVDLPFKVNDIVLKIDMDINISKSDAKISLLEEKELIAAVSAKEHRGKADNIKSPKEKDVVMVEDESDIEEWMEDIDLEKFVKSLEGKIGEDLYEMLEDVMSNGFFLSDIFESEDDYYDDYDDWYGDDWY